MSLPTPSRRDLLLGGAALSGVLLSGCRSTPEPKRPQLPRGAPRPGPLKVGLIGCGGRGTGAAYQALVAGQRQAYPGGATVRLWAMGDVFADRLESSLVNLAASLEPDRSDRLDVPEERRFVGFDAYQRVIDSGVDVVLLCTPPGFRPDHLEAAVAAGKHVFCEKPMAVDAPGVRRVLAAAERAKEQATNVVSGYCWRYKTGHRAFFDRLHGDGPGRGALGDLQAVYTNYHTGMIGTRARQEGWSDVEWQLRNWHHFDWLSGSHVVEQACHSLDMQSWAFGDVPPEAVVATGGQAVRSGPEAGNCFDHHSAIFEYPGGAMAFHSSRQWARSHNENNDYFFGTKGKGWLENWTPRYEFAGDRPWVYEGVIDDDMYQNEHDELFAAIRSGRPINDGEFMCTSTLLGIAVRTAATTGRRVTWDEIVNSEERLTPPPTEFGDLVPGALPVPGSEGAA